MALRVFQTTLTVFYSDASGDVFNMSLAEIGALEADNVVYVYENEALTRRMTKQDLEKIDRTFLASLRAMDADSRESAQLFDDEEEEDVA